MANIERTMHITGVRTVGVPVTDQDRALAFYLALGFETRLDVPMGQGTRWIELGPTGAGTSIALVRAHDGVPAGVETGVRFTSGDVEADHAALQSGGVDVDEVLRWEGVPPMFAFRDPDGNGLELVEQR
jgi:lactoylglutathione lyase